MTHLNGFSHRKRKGPPKQSPTDRLRHYREFFLPWPDPQSEEQAGRCMNCGVPFCHTGCPLGNLIPDWNTLVAQGLWKEALAELHATNNFPEFTGRICPAPCEAACTLAINRSAVTIEYLEKAIVDKGWEQGWIVPEPPRRRTGKKVAVVGSGPAGLAAAQQLNRCGHRVTVFERSRYIGGLLRLGIPDFKLSKAIVQRRVDQMQAEGVIFKTGVDVGGKSYPADRLLRDFDAVVLAGGCAVPRDLPIPGRELENIHFALPFLIQQNRINAGEAFPVHERISAKGKRVIILGGGDTGSDCLGTSLRQGAKEVHQLELLPAPPKSRAENNPWPYWPMILRRSSSQEEGGDQDYSVLTSHFSGENGEVRKLHAHHVRWGKGLNGDRSMEKIPDSEFDLEAELVLLALGFVHPEPRGLLADLQVELDGRGNVKHDENKMTNTTGVFVAGDMARGQSLVVWAIAEGREAARGVDLYLMGATQLSPVLKGALPRA